MKRWTKADYIKALQIVQEYEEQQKECDMKVITMNFPIGCYVYSKLNRFVEGKVVDYGNWYGIPSLILEKNDVKGSIRKTKCLYTNAVRLY